MAQKESIEQRPDQDEEYNSSEDEDFNPDEVAAQPDEDISSSEDEAPQPKKAPKKRKKRQTDEDELDSGDEATIKELRKSKKSKAEEEDESGGEGGLIKTRAQRKAEKVERQEYQKADVQNVTVDVDALWAALSSKPLGRIAPEPPLPLPPQEPATEDPKHDNVLATAQTDGETTQVAEQDDMIIIHRSYDFAGQTITEEKRVHKNSAEAKLFLSTTASSKQQKQQKPDESTQPADGKPALRRPLRRASKYEPNPTGEVKGLPTERQRLRTPSRADVLAQKTRLEEEEANRKGKAVKLNTVQKSAIDWAAHVDQEGYQEELDEYGRSKQGFIGKMDFLRGVHGRKEEEGRKARMAKSSAT